MQHLVTDGLADIPGLEGHDRDRAAARRDELHLERRAIRMEVHDRSHVPPDQPVLRQVSKQNHGVELSHDIPTCASDRIRGDESGSPSGAIQEPDSAESNQRTSRRLYCTIDDEGSAEVRLDESDHALVLCDSEERSGRSEA